jgi:hypothetical protein
MQKRNVVRDGTFRLPRHFVLRHRCPRRNFDRFLTLYSLLNALSPLPSCCLVFKLSSLYLFLLPRIFLLFISSSSHFCVSPALPISWWSSEISVTKLAITLLEVINQSCTHHYYPLPRSGHNLTQFQSSLRKLINSPDVNS